MLKIAMLQLNAQVGDIDANVQTIRQVLLQAQQQGADIAVCPELALIGYPPEDLLFRSSLASRIETALNQLLTITPNMAVVIGYPRQTAQGLFNTAGVLYQGQCVFEYHKQQLPNYQIFDEKRYFTAGTQPGIWCFHDVRIGLTICEDIWVDQPVEQLREQGIDLMINLSASPFHLGKVAQRQSLLQRQAQRLSCPIIYVNRVGAQDELVFDGSSQAVDANGNVQVRAAFVAAEVSMVQLNDQHQLLPGTQADVPDMEAQAYQILMQGLRDYVHKNGFKRCLLGLSGGIDSALTLAIAVDALGAECVGAVMMPFRYTSPDSIEWAQQQADAMQVPLQSISIESAYEALLENLPDAQAATPAAEITRQNLQARVRGVLLMSLSNVSGALVLTTSNKSELAVGYSTLYGDMAGGFDVLKDVSKTLVYQLARYRNRLSPVIPQGVIDRPPTAELAPGQQDSDSLPDYPTLDAMLAAYVEADLDADQLKQFDVQQLQQVIKRIDRNEYKRRQGPPGVRLTTKSFVRDRRYPLTYRW
jgi:NAD+ synthase (glutamine-hydrolysing)